jgi:hypothetical protein
LNIKLWLGTFQLRLRSLFRRKQVELDLSEELQFHLDQKTQGYMSAGFTPDEALRKARREFGGLEQSKETAAILAASASLKTCSGICVSALGYFATDPHLLSSQSLRSRSASVQTPPSSRWYMKSY